MKLKAFSRRQFVRWIMIALGAGVVPARQRALAGIVKGSSDKDEGPNPPSFRPPLADTPDKLLQLTETDVLVIGSGYGGAITAARLAPQVSSLVVLERGREWRPGEFPKTPVQAVSAVYQNSNPKTNRLGLFRLIKGKGVSVICGSGLGGTSLINAAVALRPKSEIFQDPRWPSDLNEPLLAPYYESAETMLAVATTPGGVAGFAKTRVLERAALTNQVSIDSVPLAVNFTEVGGDTPTFDPQPNAEGVLQTRCRLCGDCMTGCNFGSKNTVDTNYLPLAKSLGASLFTQTNVSYFERLSDGRYQVHYERLSSGVDDPAFTGSIITKVLVLSSGTLGSSGLLLRTSQMGNLAFSSQLGKGFSANGDVIALAYNGNSRTEIAGIGSRPKRVDQEGECGPSVVSAVSIPVTQSPAVVEDLSMPSLVGLALARPLGLLCSGYFRVGSEALKRCLVDILPKRNSRGALAHSMLVIGLGTDSASGELVLDKHGEAEVNWPNAIQESAFVQISQWLGKLTNRTSGGGGGIFHTLSSWINLNGLLDWLLPNNIVTAHPLGGCCMGETVEQGVVDSRGRVFEPSTGSIYPGLYVNDGSIIPTPLGVNPLLTISALAERNAAEIIKQDDSLWAARPR